MTAIHLPAHGTDEARPIRRQWVMAKRPDGPVSEANFCLVEVPLPTIGDGEFLLRTLYLSVAPVMRQYMIDGAGIERPLEPGDVIYGRGVAQVIASHHDRFPVGMVVHGKIGWQDYAVSDGAADKLERFPIIPAHNRMSRSNWRILVVGRYRRAFRSGPRGRRRCVPMPFGAWP